jgi:hypothetical protein
MSSLLKLLRTKLLFLLLAVLAVGLAVGTSAYTKSKDVKQTAYWFATDVNGNPLPSSTLHTNNYLGCSADGVDCIAEYTSYTINSSGQYMAAGTQEARYAHE